LPRIVAHEIQPGHFVPLLTIGIELNSSQLSFLALVDSGADSTILTLPTIEACGMGWDDLSASASPGIGAGGGFETRSCAGVLRYGATELCREFLVAKPDALPGALLGRDDFFTKFVVRFAWHRKPPDFNVDPVRVGGKRRA
jgi:hypothetical protein